MIYEEQQLQSPQEVKNAYRDNLERLLKINEARYAQLIDEAISLRYSGEIPLAKERIENYLGL